MKLEELLNTFNELAKNGNLSEPFIVGGFPRDKALGLKTTQIEDIDITTGNKDCLALALLASKQWPEAFFRSYDDGHVSLSFKNIRIDFSNNFILPGIEKELEKIGITDPTQLQKEIFSRDFTINTLLQPMDLSKELRDLTGTGIKDLRAKILRTPINPDLTIGFDPRRILRALKLSIRFGFSIDEELSKTMLKYRGAVGQLPIGHVKRQVNQMFKLDPKKAILLLSEYKLLPIVPINKLMAMEMAKHRMIQHLLDGGL